VHGHRLGRFNRWKPKGKMYSLRCNQCGEGFLSINALEASTLVAHRWVASDFTKEKLANPSLSYRCLFHMGFLGIIWTSKLYVENIRMLWKRPFDGQRRPTLVTDLVRKRSKLQLFMGTSDNRGEDQVFNQTNWFGFFE